MSPNPSAEDPRYCRIWQTVAGIPRGCVLNYGEVARLAGLPGQARLVGRALGLAPKQMALPWHRVINAQGRISFKPGGGEYRLQRRLLEREGIEFKNERVDLSRYHPSRTLDRLFWGPAGR